VATLLSAVKPRVSPGQFPVSLRNRVLLETLYLAGLRVQEACDLHPQDVDLGQRLLYIRHSKRDKSRNVPIGPRLYLWLQQWQEARPAAAECFFCTWTGAQVSRSQVWQTIQSACRKAGLDPEGAKPHKFRHTYATELLEDGFNLEEVRVSLGHSCISTTSIYLHTRPEVLMAKTCAREEKMLEAALLDMQEGPLPKSPVLSLAV